MKKLALLFGVLIGFCMGAVAQQSLRDNGGLMNNSVKNGITVLECGETIRFYDDGGDGNHSKSMNVVHTIKSPVGTRIRIHFNSFALSSGSHLKAYNGGAVLAAALDADASGTSGAADFVSDTNVYTLEYKTTKNTVRAGWDAVISVEGCPDQLDPVTLPCGSAPMTVGGSNINDEGSAYGSVFKERTFMTGLGTTLTMNFTDMPDNEDKVVVYDGPNYNSPILTTITSATSSPYTIVSTGNALTVRLSSNASGSWEATIKPDMCLAATSVSLTESDCATTFNIGGDYTTEMYQATTYTGPTDSRFVINFSALPNDDSYDYVEIYDGDLTTGTRRGRYFGETLPRVIYSASNVITVLFRSNDENHGTWGATVSLLCLEDLGTMTFDCSTSTSAYAINRTYTNLQYTKQVFVSTDPEAQILLDFAATGGMPHDDDNDFVEIYDGADVSARLIGRYYGYGRPRTIGSTGTAMTVVFLSNATEAGSWSAAVSIDCPDVITMPKPGYYNEETHTYQTPQTITTCNAILYDDGGSAGNYSPGLDGEYIVLRPGRPGNVLYLEGEYEFDWQHDYITIYDGEGTDGEILWGGGLHGHGYPRHRHTSTAHPCEPPCDNCLGAVPGLSSDGSAVKNRLITEGKTCVMYYPKVTSKTGSLTISFHTSDAAHGDNIVCSGFNFSVKCVPMPDDCYHNGVVVFRQTFDEYEDDAHVVHEYPVNDASPWMTSIPTAWNSACTYTFQSNGMTGNGGKYAIRAFACDNYEYFNYLDDHTHPGNIQRGYLFNIDASAAPGDFYKGYIHLDCPGVEKLLVSFWAANVNNSWYLPEDEIHFPQIKMGFYSNEACTELLAEESTGHVPRMEMHGCMSDPNDWQYYSLELPNVPGTDIWFKISNMAENDQGNDFAIDDIEVRACLPPSMLTRIGGEHEIFSSANVCAGEELRLVASLDETLGSQSLYENKYYAWERGENEDPSNPDSPIIWTRMVFGSYDREGEWATCEDCERLAYTNSADIGYPTDDPEEDHYENYNDITIVEIPSPTAPAYTHYYYRVIIAGSIEGLNSRYCRSISDPYEIVVTRIPEIEFGGTNAICEGGTINLSITETSPTPGTWTIYSENGETDPSTFNASIVNGVINEVPGYHVVGALHDEIVVQYQTSPENGGCWNRKTIPIYPLPEIEINPDRRIICEGTAITLEPTSNQHSGFQWVGGPGCTYETWQTDNACANWSVTPASTTRYTVSVTTPYRILKENGNPANDEDYITLTCVDTKDKELTVLPIPTNLAVSGIPGEPVCRGSEVTLTPSATGSGTGTLYYSWDNGAHYYTSAQSGYTLTVTPTDVPVTHYTLRVKEVWEIEGVSYDCNYAELSVDVGVYEPPTLTIGTLTHLKCFGIPTGVIPASASGGNPGDGTPGNPAYEFSLDGVHFYHDPDHPELTHLDFPGLSAGSYTVYVKDQHCFDSKSVTLEERPQLIARIHLPIEETCVDQSIGSATVEVEGGTPFGTEPGTYYEYEWNTTPVQTTATAMGLGAHIYTVKVTDANECSATTTVEITARDVPTYTLSGNDLTKCLSSPSATFTVTPDDSNSADAEVTNYSWEINTDITDPTLLSHAGLPSTHSGSTLNSITVTPDAVGTYVYTVTLTAQDGCQVSSDFNLTISEPPTIALTSSSGTESQTKCYGDFPAGFNNIIFTFGGGATGVNFEWTSTPAPTCLSYDAGTMSISATGTAPTEGASYSYRAVTTTAAGNTCPQETIEGTITIRPQLTVSVTADHTACENDDIGEATALGHGGNPGTGSNPEYTYAWSNTETTATIDGLSAGTYTVTVTDGVECSATNSVVIEEKTNPTISILSSNVNCYGETTGSIAVTITNYGTTAGTSNPYTNGPTTQPNYYVFSTDNGTTTVNSSGENYEQHTFAVSTNGSSSYTYNIYVRDGNDCTVRQNVEITQPSLLTATIDPDDVVKTCTDQSVGAATVTPGGGTSGYTYRWNTVAEPLWASDRTTQTISDLPVGNYRVTVTDAHTCTATATVAIEERTVPNFSLDVTGPSNKCYYDNETEIVVSNGGTGSTYAWSASSTEAGLPAGSDVATVTVTPAVGTHTYTVSITATNGCVVTASVPLTIYPVPTVALSESATAATCNGYDDGEFSLVATGGTIFSDGTTPNPPYYYQFSIDGGSNYTPYYSSDNSQVQHTVSGQIAGTYNVVVSDVNGCTASISGGVTVTEPTPVNARIETDDIHTTCYNQSIGEILVTPYGGTPGASPAYTYAWSDNVTSAQIADGGARIINLAAETYSVTVTDSHGCSGTNSAIVDFRPVPTYTLSDNGLAKCLTPDPQTQLTVNISASNLAPVAMYAWTVDDATHAGMPATTSGATLNSITVNPDAAGTYNYTVTITAENGCIVSSDFQTTIHPVPSVTAPAGDIVAATCFGDNNGAFTLIATGGTIFSDGTTPNPPYYYHFSINGAEDDFYSSDNSQVQHTVSGVNAGTYNVIVSDVYGCTASISGGVTVPQPTAVNAQIDPTDIQTTCYDQSIGEILVTPYGGTPGTSPAYTYTWSDNVTSAQIADGGARIINLAAGTYSVTVTDSHTCTGTNTVTVDPRPVPTYTLSDDGLEKCLSDAETELTVNISASNEAPVAMYTWTVDDATHAGMPATTSGATLNSITVEPDLYGTYIYTVTIRAENECVVSSNYTLAISRPPTVSITSGTQSPTHCYNRFLSDFADITFGYDGGATGLGSIQWSPETPTCLSYDAGTMTISAVSDAPTAGAAYTYRIGTTTADGNVCPQDFVEGTITIRPQLTVDITDVHQSCVTGDIGTATASPAGGNPGSSPAYTYEWSTHETSATISDLEGDITYTVTVTDGEGCTVANSVDIEKKVNPTITVTHENVSCNGAGDGKITVVVTTPGADNPTPYSDGPTSQPYYYVFSSDNGATEYESRGEEQYAQHTFINLATDAHPVNSRTYNIYVRDGNDCTATKAETITQPVTLTATIDTDHDVINSCTGQAVGQATVVAHDGTYPYTYSWSTDPVQSLETATGLALGTYTVRVEDAHECIATAQVSIGNRPVPSITAVTNTVVCESELPLTLTVVNAGNTEAISSYSWSVAPTDNAGITGETNGATLNVRPTNYATHRYTQHIVAVNGCEVEGYVDLLVNPNPTVALGDVTQPVCPSAGSIEIGATLTYTNPIATPTPPYTYTWTDDGSFAVSSTTPSTSSATTATSVTATVSVPAPNGTDVTCSENYTLKVQVTDNNGCSSTVATRPVLVEDYTAPVWSDPLHSWTDIVPDILGQDACFEDADTTGLWDGADIADLYSDNCGQPVRVINEEDVAVQTSNCGWKWTRTYTIVDACGNPVEPAPSMSISGSDQSAPEWSSSDAWAEVVQSISGQNACLADRVISEFYSNDAVKALFSDCSQITVTSNTVDDPDVVTGDDCGWTVTRTYTIKDLCDNVYYLPGTTNKPTMSISGSDQTAPEWNRTQTWAELVQNITGQNACFADADTTGLLDDDEIAAFYTDHCGQPVTVTHGENGNGKDVAVFDPDSDHDCGWTWTRTYNITDACNNPVTPAPSMSVSGSDQTLPTISSTITEVNATGSDCVYTIPDLISDLSSYTVNDNCSDDSYLLGTISQSPLAGTEVLMSQDVTITIRDACGWTGTTTIHVDVPTTVHTQATPPEICLNESTNLTVYSGGSSTSFSYVWSDGENVWETLDTPDAENSITVTPTGTTTYGVTVTDASGCIQATEITVTVKPLPEITFTDLGNVCPNGGTQEIVANIAATTPGYTYEWSCSELTFDASTTGTQDETTFTIGAVVPNDATAANYCDRSYTIVLHVTDNDLLQCEYEAPYILVVKDEDYPQITCPENIPVNTDLHANTAYVTVPAPVITENCAGYYYTNSFNSAVSESASDTYPLGTTIVTYTVFDICGNSDECQFSIIVSDDEYPCIGCDPDPSDPTVEGLDCAGIEAELPAGNRIPTTTGHNYYEHHNGGSYGSWDVTATDNVTDQANLVRECVLRDSENHEIGRVSTLEGFQFPLGTTTITWTIYDEFGNPSDPCSFTITVYDGEAPCIGCDPDPSTPENEGISCTTILNGNTSLVVYTEENTVIYTHHGDNWDVTATDNHHVDRITYTLDNVNCATPSVLVEPNTTLDGQVFNIGTTRVIWTAYDDAGNPSEPCELLVTVIDNQPPCIGCDPDDPDDPFTPVDPNDPNSPNGISCESIVAFMGGEDGIVRVGTSDYVNYYIHNNHGEDGNWDVTANDNVGIASVVCNLTGATTATGLASLHNQHFNIGRTVVTWVVTDASTPANVRDCSFTVIVTDDDPPCIGCDPDPSNPNPFNPTTGVSCASLTSGDGTITVYVPEGLTYYEHTDDSWNVDANDNSGIRAITYTLSGATTAVNGSPETLNGQRFNVGQTTVLWTATDIYGLTDTCSFIVNVLDTIPPDIECPQPIANITCINEVPAAYQTYEQFVAAGGHAEDPNLIDESSFILVSEVSDGNICPEVITRTYQISDLYNNPAICTQTITVMDNISPVITGLAPTINVSQSPDHDCRFLIPDFTEIVRSMSSDNCTPRENLTIVQTPAAGSGTVAANTDVRIAVTDACGNDSAVIVGHIVVPQPLTHTVDTTEILCAGGQSTITINGVGGIAPYTGVGERLVTAGTYNYTITDANGCTSAVNVTVHEPPRLVAEIPALAVNPVACFGQSTGSASVSVLGGTPGYTYMWNNGVQTQTASNLIAGRYTVTVTDAKGCSSTADATIEGQDSQIRSQISDSTNVLCYGMATGSATVMPSGGSPSVPGPMGYDYQWSTSPEQTTQTATNLVAGSYTVTVRDSHGCISTSTVNISEPESALAATIAPGAIHDVACYGESTGSIVVTPSGGTVTATHGYTYSWNPSSQTTQTATNLPVGQYVVTVTDANGCQASASATVSGQSYPLVASFAEGSSLDVLCFGNATGSATVTVTGGSPDYRYSWNTIPEQTTSTATNLTAGNYVVSVTDDNGCSTTASIRINGQGTPLAPSILPTNVTNVACNGMTTGSATVTVSGGTPTNEAPGYYFSWDNGQSEQTLVNVGAGTYTVTITDAHSCTATSSVTITQPAPLQLSTTATDATCGATGGSVTAIVTGGTGQYEYSWTNSLGHSYSGIRLTNVAPSRYELTVTDFNGCIITSSATVRANGSLSARIDIVELPGCGNNVSAGRLQAVAESGISPFSYTWSNGSTEMQASNLQAGSYTVTLVDSWGCSANATISIEQQNDLEISVSTTEVSCFGESNASATVVALRGEPPYSYTWSNGANSAFLQNIAAGRYSITVTDANMCAKAETIVIEQPDKLMLESNVKPISCFGKTDGSIALNAEGGNQPYSFSIVMNEHSYSGNYLSGLPAGTYTLEVTDVHGCMTTNTIQLVEPEQFTSSYSVGMPSCSGNNDGFIEISATGGTKPYMYGWDSYYSDVPMITGLRQGQYSVSVVDANKCTYQVASITITDMAGDCIKIPNVFTPNGDGVNDTWIIENIEMFPDATVYVFNRWGQMLYKGTGKDEPWDGSYRGHYVPAGTYLYIVDLYQKTEAYKGTVTVIY